MKKKTIQSFFILTFTTTLSKIFNILNRIILSHLLGTAGFGLYMLVMPTLGLSITLSQISIPSALFKLIADPHYRNKKVITTGVFLTCITTMIMCLIGFVSFPYIASHLLQNKDALLPLRMLLLFVPLTSISSIIKNYFLGKQQHKIIAKTQITEEVVRLLATIIFLTVFKNKSLSFLVALSFLAMSLGELASIMHLCYYIEIPMTRSIFDFSEPLLYHDFFRISLPLTGSRLLHSLTSFLEPIILTTILVSLGFSMHSIQLEYGMMSGYVMSLITIPTFLTTVIYRLLLPLFLEHKNDTKKILHYFYVGLGVCFLIALPFTFMFYFFPETCLSFLYHTTQGASYLKYLSVPFILYYLQTPLAALMQAYDLNKAMFITSIMECSLEVFLLIVLTPCFKIVSIGITLLLGILTNLILSALCLYFKLFHNKE